MFEMMFPGISTLQKLILIKKLLDEKKKAQEEKGKSNGQGNS